MLVGLVAAFFATPALAQPDPSGIDFVTIGAPGNPAYSGPDINNRATGRGGVGYEYRLGRTEVTTAQWMEFYNAFWGRAPHLTLPVRWGAGSSGNPNEPFRLTSADSGMWPAGGMTWRTCAMFCNWLHNDKRTDLDAVMTGAYDASTFGEIEGRFTDQREHSPGARYWIPTLDEWIKGAYYDPNYGGTGIGGWWWANVNGTNNAPTFGPPGQGEGNAGFNLPGEGHFRIPLMAYPQTVSPWGMLDASGATREYLETVLVVDTIPNRFTKGSAWSEFGGRSNVIFSFGGEFANSSTYQLGLRIATIPSPQAFLVIAAGFAALTCRRVRVSAKEMSDETVVHAGCPPDCWGACPFRFRRQ